MDEYHKIDTVWKRDQGGRICIGDYSQPAFEYLKDCQWIGTEKVDGTNIRVKWDGLRVEYGGKTEQAQLPATLIQRLRALFEGGYKFLDKFSQDEVCLYGEGYGAKINKGGGNYKATQDFVLFDVFCGGLWLERDNVNNIADHFGIAIVPHVFTGTLVQACAVTKEGIESQWGPFAAEGMVLRPKVELRNRRGDRIITKIKSKDYARLAQMA